MKKRKMMYFDKLERRAQIKDGFAFVGGGFIAVLNFFWNVIKVPIHIVSSLLFMVLAIPFPFGCYFAFTVGREVLNGTSFSDTTNYGFFLLFFCAPLVAGVVKYTTSLD